MSHRFARAGFPTDFVRVAATITGSATPHAEGAYTQILASTAADVVMMCLNCSADVSGATVDTSMLFTLAIGGAGSETDVVTNVAQGGHAGPQFRGYRVWLPLHIPAGTRIAGKLRAEVVSDTFGADLDISYGSRIPGWGGYSVSETLGADTANSRGTVISNTAGTWTQISASTPNPYRAFNVAFGLVDSSSTAATHTVDVGVGAAASETIIGTWTIQTSVNESLFNLNGPPFLEKPIPAGTRIAMKKDTTADLSAVFIGWR